MHDNRHARSPVIITIALYGTCMAHIFIWVCALLYNGVSPSTFVHHLGHQHLLAPPPRCSRHQAGANARPRLLGNKPIDQCQPQSAWGARTGMQDRRDPRPVARTRPGSSVQGDSCCGVRCKTIPQLSHVLPDVRMRPLPAVEAGQRGARVQ